MRLNTIKAITKIIKIGAQNGAVTHHHDQSITLHSFNVMKISPSKPKIPIPPDAAFELLEILFFFLFELRS